RIRVPAEAADAGGRPGMALLDGAIQCSLADVAGASEEGDASPTYVAVGLERLRLHRALDGVTGPVWVEARDRVVEGQQGGDRVCDIRVRDDASATVAEIHGLRLRRIERSAPPAEERGEAPTWFYDIAWEEAPEVEDAAALDSVLPASPRPR